MDRPRLKFYLVLALFLGWVVGLGAMSYYSADRPRTLPASPEPTSIPR